MCKNQDNPKHGVTIASLKKKISTCFGLHISYIGETSRHIKSRIKNIHEKIRCHKFINICNEACFTSYNDECFSGWENPELNRQIKHVSATLAD